jgi:hypothetical protein
MNSLETPSADSPPATAILSCVLHESRVQSHQKQCHSQICFSVSMTGSRIKDHWDRRSIFLTESFVSTPQVPMNNAWCRFVGKQFTSFLMKLFCLFISQTCISSQFEHVTQTMLVPKVGPVVNPRQIGLWPGANGVVDIKSKALVAGMAMHLQT